MDFMAGYYEADKGRFDSALVRRSDRTAIACTRCDYVEAYIPGTVDNADRKAIVAFAEQYDLPIRWDV
jgi:hypothetical protein